MTTSIFFLSALVSVLALFLGFFIAKWTAEEIKNGWPYLVWTKDLVLAVIVCVAVNSVFSIVTSVISAVLVFVLVVILHFTRVQSYLKSLQKGVWSEVIIYVLLAVATFFRQDSLIFSLIFLYGLPAGSMLRRKRLSWKKVFIPVAVFLVIVLLRVLLP